jgi:hypothetical protein
MLNGVWSKLKNTMMNTKLIIGLDIKKKENMRQSYLNAYNLFVGKTTYDELANQGEFYLPVNHDNKNVLLNYFESTEEYEKCSKIIKL